MLQVMCILLQLPKILLGEVVMENPLAYQYLLDSNKTTIKSGSRLDLTCRLQSVDPYSRNIYIEEMCCLGIASIPNTLGIWEMLLKNMGYILIITEVSLWVYEG